MAFASIGALGSARSVAANQTALSIPTLGSALATDFVVVAVAVDNSSTISTAPILTNVVDSGGNLWERAFEYTNSGTGVQSGAACAVWASRLNTTLASGGGITVSFVDSTSSDATAAMAWRFSTSSTSQSSGVQVNAGAAQTAASVGSVNVTTTNVECLRVRAIASETNNSVAITSTSGWTVLTQVLSSTGGVSTANLGIRGEFVITTSTTGVSNPGAGPTGADHASVYVAFNEMNLTMPTVVFI